jgi:hypothetical protein
MLAAELQAEVGVSDRSNGGKDSTEAKGESSLDVKQHDLD